MMAEDDRSRSGEIAALRLGHDLGLTVIDTAKMYGEGEAETAAGFEALAAAGKIRRRGVGNFDVEDLEELGEETDLTRCAANQALYDPTRRGIEFDLMPFRQRIGAPLMACSPIGQGRLPHAPRSI